MKHSRFDFIVIGTGLAGLYAAANAANYGTVALLCKTEPKDSNSYRAQGGIAAAVDPEDSVYDHYTDTVIAGRGLCDELAVKILVAEGKERIQDLVKMGMRFDEDSLGQEGGHGKRRILHADKGTTGKVIIDLLVWKVRQNKNITILPDSYVYHLSMANNRVNGAMVFNLKNHSSTYLSGRVIIASGGGSGIYKRTTNPYGATGDGITMAYNSGAVVTGLEFLQFHPTAYYAEEKTYLISEAVRGEGTLLINEKGERFMESVHELAELAPRDVVARAIFNEIKNSSSGHVFLRFDKNKHEYLEERFQNIFDEIKTYGINPPEEDIPVAPAAHYLIGGVKTNYNAESSVKGLYVCGEAAYTGVHGANRLASNSLLECLVFAHRAVESAHNDSVDHKNFDFPEMKFDENLKPEYVEHRINIGELMTTKVGIIRSESSLKSALSDLSEIKKKVKENNYEYYNHRLSSVILLAELIAISALKRKGSRGGHFREDFPEMNTDLNYHIFQQKDRNPFELPH